MRGRRTRVLIVVVGALAAVTGAPAGVAGAGVPVVAPVCTGPPPPEGCDPPPPPGKQQAVNQSYGMSPSPGDYDGDGLTDLAWSNGLFALTTMWWATGSGTFVGGPAPALPGTTNNVSGDFDADGADELLWYDGTLWDFADRTAAVLAAGPPLSWTYPGEVHGYAADFDGDGIDDVLWYSPYEGDQVWFGGPAGFTVVGVGVTGYFRPLLGDFDGDGKDDVFWVDPYGIDEDLWYGRDRTGFDVVGVGSNWPGDGGVVGDHDGNGGDDIVWFWPQPGGDIVWYADGRGFRDQHLVNNGVPPFGADLDGDGDDELVWAASDTIQERGDIIGRFPPPGFVDFVAISVVDQYLPIVGEFGGTAAEDVLWVNHTQVVDPVWWS